MTKTANQTPSSEAQAGRTISRRSLLKWSAALGGAATLAGGMELA